MRAKLVAWFFAGFAAGVVALALVLWAGGTLRSAAAPPPPETAPPQSGEPAPERLLVPVAGARMQDILDTFNEPRPGGGHHEAVDIMAPRGTPVLAADEGNVAKLFTSKAGGFTVYQFDDSRNWCYYYAHLDHYEPGLKEGDFLRRGDRLGYVGSTGDASPDAPHLHFGVYHLGPDKRWWTGTPVDPYPLLTGPR